jgi:hypothetical protein
MLVPTHHIKVRNSQKQYHQQYFNPQPFQGRESGRGRFNPQPYQNINTIKHMNTNYAYEQGLMEGAGLVQNQPKRKVSQIKNEKDFRKKGYKKFNLSANVTEELSEGEEDEIIDDDQSVRGDNTLGTIHTSQEVVDPFEHTILSPKREKLDRHDHLWPVIHHGHAL